MPKSKYKNHREALKPRVVLPAVPDLGNLAMPRMSNRAAAKYVASVGLLWDRRRADRKALKVAQKRSDAVSENPRKKHLDKAVRERMLRVMTAWSFDHQTKAFVPLGVTLGGSSHAVSGVTAQRVEELLEAVINLKRETVVLRVSGLSFAEASRVRGYLGMDSALISVNQQQGV
jgi:hypothetical protein